MFTRSLAFNEKNVLMCGIQSLMTTNHIITLYNARMHFGCIIKGMIWLCYSKWRACNEAMLKKNCDNLIMSLQVKSSQWINVEERMC